MTKMMRAMQKRTSNSKLKLVEIPIPTPAEEEVLIEIETCGVCNGDSVAIEGNAPEYPIIPGHEVIGTIKEIGSKVAGWGVGQRVGIGFHAGKGKINGLSIDGGYAEYMVANGEHIIEIPDIIESAEASPLMCAGETTFSALLKSLASPGDLVGIQGLGGLGHLALQYADKFGFETVAISRGEDKRSLVKTLGATHYINSTQNDVAEELKALGGAKVILTTVPDGRAIAPLLKGLKKGGQLMVVSGSSEKIDLSPSDLLGNQLSIKGSFTAGKKEIAKMLHFSIIKNVKPMVEIFSLEQAALAYEKMKNSEVQFRAVLKIK